MRSAASIASSVDGSIGTSGERNGCAALPSFDSAYFTPVGFGSMNSALCSGISLSWIASALA